MGMKLQELKQIIKEEVARAISELEIGNVLFGEPKGRYNPQRLGVSFEPNTEDEKQILDLLRKWITAENNSPELGEFLKQLLPFKKKFPVILDPTQGRSVYEGNKFYRGTLLSIKDLTRMGGWKINNSADFQYGAIESETPYTWKSIGTQQKGFTSFTPVVETADGFAITYMKKGGAEWSDIIDRLEDNRGMLPVILVIKDTYPNALMNPEVMEEIGGMGEYEVLVVGEQINVDSIVIPNWDFLQKAANESGVDLSKYFKGI